MPAQDKTTPVTQTPNTPSQVSPVISSGEEEWKQHLLNSDPLSSPGPVNKKSSPPQQEPQHSVYTPPPPQRAPNMTAGAQQSKFKPFDQRVKVIKQEAAEKQQATPTDNNKNTSQEKAKPVRTALTTSLGVAALGIEKAASTFIKGYKSSALPAAPRSEHWQSRLGTGFKQWADLRLAYPELEEIQTIEQFKQWLAKHPGIKLGDQPVTLADWQHHDDFYEYKKLQDEVDTTTHQEHKQKSHPKIDYNYLAPIHSLAQTDSDEAINKESTPSEKKKPQRPQNATPHPAPPPEIPIGTTYDDYQRQQKARYEFRGASSTPIFASQTGNFRAFNQRVQTVQQTASPQSNVGNEPTMPPGGMPPPPPPSSRGGVPRRGGAPGIGRAGNLASTALNFLPAGRVINIVLQNKVIIGVAIFVIIFLILSLFSDTGDAVPEVSKTTQDIVVTPVPQECTDNPQDCADAADSTKATLLQRSTIASSGKSTVLGTSSDQEVLAWTSWSPAKLKEIREQIAKSTITYNITASYPGQADDIKVTDNIPSNGLFLSASGRCHVIYEGQRVSQVWWSVKENQGVDQTKFSRCEGQLTPTPSATYTPTPEPEAGVRGASTQKIDITKYQGPPYYLPAPKGAPTTSYSSTDINNANALGAAIAAIQPYLLTRLTPEKADPFLAVMWTMAIEGSGADPYFWNCNQTNKGKQNISKGCRGWYNAGNWQVGYGIQVAQAGSHLEDDFKAIYGSADAAKVQEVGNKVLKDGGITNPLTMPSKSVKQLVQEAGSPGTIFQYRPTTDTEAAAQQAIAILLMDQKIGAASIAQEVAADIGNNWAESMRGWKQDYYTKGLDPNNPTFSNNIKLLTEQYTGSSSDTPPGNNTNATFAPMTFSDKILPLVKNDLFKSLSATVEVIGGRGGSKTATDSGTTSGSGTSSGVGCTKVSDPPGSDWAKVNSRDELITKMVLEIQKTDGTSQGTCIPVNLVKALVYEESGGEMLPVNLAGYGGIMQVGVGSNCDHNKYDIYTLEGNVGCGVSHLTRGYIECGTWEGTITAYYAGHCTPNGAADDPNQGGSGETDFQYRDRIINRWHELDGLTK